LWTLTEETKKIEGNIIEIGTWRGGTGAILAKKSQMLGPSTQVIICDTFKGVVKASNRDNQYRGGEHDDTSELIVKELYKCLNLNNVQILKGIFPDETGMQVQDLKFRLCHIDVDVYQSGKDIIDWIWPKLSLGGIIVFDDFSFPLCQGVRDLVEEQRKFKDRLVIHNLNGHGLVIRIK